MKPKLYYYIYILHIHYCIYFINSSGKQTPYWGLSNPERTFLVCIFSVLRLKATYGSLLLEPSRFSCFTAGMRQPLWHEFLFLLQYSNTSLINSSSSLRRSFASCKVTNWKKNRKSETKTQLQLNDTRWLLQTQVLNDSTSYTLDVVAVSATTGMSPQNTPSQNLYIKNMLNPLRLHSPFF